jgi:outer membrane protein TolC
MRWLIVLAAFLGGCTRAYYRNSADRETYHAVRERTNDPRWALPIISVYPPPGSRLHDPFNPDHPPLPPDDPAAARYMRCADGHPGYRHWHRDGDAPWIEDPRWRAGLQLTAEGELELTPERSVELGLLDSREYQNQLDNLYTAALALTLNRYEFALHWFAINDTDYTHFGSGADELDTLTTSSRLGFNKAFTAGGQLMVELANSFVFQFADGHSQVTQSNIIINFVQPLLRGAGRDVRMEGLTEAERTLLYTVRTFAHFRKQFSVSIATSGYLQLLLQLQSIRNQEANVLSLEQNLRLQQALLGAGIVSIVEVDQVFQQLQQARLSVLQAQTSLADSLDNFKILLGLPPVLPVKVNDSLLDPFQLNDPRLIEVQKNVETLLTEFRELEEAPPLARLREGYDRLRLLHRRGNEQVGKVQAEIDRWKAQPIPQSSDPEQAARTRQAQETLSAQLPGVGAELKALAKDIEKSAAALSERKLKDGWETLQKQIRRENSLVGELVIIQTQVRVFLIRLEVVHYEEAPAVQYALENRLDLMNQRAQVVDAWRKIDVAANLLKGVANPSFAANIGTKPGGINPFDFRSSNSSYTVGIHLEAPLDRQAERNAYRASLLNYEEARRSFMALEDNIERQIRADLRQLETARQSFEINRQSLITAARAVEAAQDRLLIAETATDSTQTINVLNALNSLLTAKQQLISSWVSYETEKIQLKLDLEELQLDERGLYSDDPRDQPRFSFPANGGNRDQTGRPALPDRPEVLPEPRPTADGLGPGGAR